MNAPHRPHTLVTPVDVANVRTEQWCGSCKAYSGFLLDVIALFPAAVTVIGTVTGCVICDDPDDPEVQRG
ncbi:hypothetical protein [Streptomyces sp. AGS-58]|uniref:hypothetical protein n=1 Tax=unclassified Streptomyces TaxID=2593676 RepID=UPI0035A303FE